MNTTKTLKRIANAHDPANNAKTLSQVHSMRSFVRYGYTVAMMLSLLMTTAFATQTGDAAGAIEQGMKSGLKEVYTILTAVAVPIAVICIGFCAVKIFMGGEKGMEQAKKLAIYTAVGLAVVYLAPAIVTQVAGWFSDNNTAVDEVFG